MKSRSLFSKVIFGASVILEQHTLFCTCSYCKDAEEEKTFFVWLPKSRKRNSWRVIGWKKCCDNFYLRSTLPQLSFFLGYHFSKWTNGWRLKILPGVWCKTHSSASLVTICPSSAYKTKIPYVESLFGIDMRQSHKGASDQTGIDCAQVGESVK